MTKKRVFVLIAAIGLASILSDRAMVRLKAILVEPVTIATASLHLGDGQPVDVLHPGEAFYIRIRSTRRAHCVSEISYAIAQQSDLPDGTHYRKFFYVYRNSVGYTSIGDFMSDERKVVPHWLPPGQYLFIRFAKYSCNRLEIDYPTPPIPFEVVGPPQDDTD